MSLLYKVENIAQQAFNLLPHKKPTVEQLRNCKLVAHRGAHGISGAHNNQTVLENSWKAFDLCLQNQIWGMEFDIHFTSDLTPVIHHDAHLGRFFNKPQTFISQLTTQEIVQNCRQIPLLSDVLDHFGKKIHLMIEIKHHLSVKQVEVLKSLLQPLDPVLDYHFLYLDPALAYSIDFVPSETHVLVGELNLLKMSELAKNQDRWGGVAGPYMLLNRKRIDLHQKLGQKIGTGYADTQNLLFHELRRGIDWTFTNQALLMQDVLNASLKSP